MDTSEWDEYMRLDEPNQRAKSESWQAAIGLQDVDGLKISPYLLETAKKNIDGELSFYEARERIDAYYQIQSSQTAENRTEEADKVAVRIAELLSEDHFTFSPMEYLLTHQRLFEGVLDQAIVGKARTYNIKKQEWVLQGQSVVYAHAAHIMQTLDYDFAQERDFSYQGLSSAQILEHLGKFIARLWQIHAFGEGNTRTTAVFAIKYLRTLGFQVNNDLFAEHSWYFRNALVRANYNNYPQGIHATPSFLIMFLENLLLGQKYVLSNRAMLIELIN
ncbi:MAG: Fic family protein [Akkermansia sp.]